MKTSLLVLLAAITTVSAFAKDEVKNARSNDVASKYTLKDNGDLFRTVGRRECQITTGVDDFKVSKHKYDTAMIYFVKGGDLYILKNADTNGECPKLTKKSSWNVSLAWTENINTMWFQTRTLSS